MEQLERKIDQVDRRLQELRDWLIGEPESSALGRQLLQRAVINAQNIERQGGRIESLEDWRTEWSGVWRFVTGLGVVLGVIGTFLGLLAAAGAIGR
jgi:hypothetical protein